MLSAEWCLVAIRPPPAAAYRKYDPVGKDSCLVRLLTVLLESVPQRLSVKGSNVQDEFLPSFRGVIGQAFENFDADGAGIRQASWVSLSGF